jgi:PTH1 family peptidyl-tRNA hydrolase
MRNANHQFKAVIGIGNPGDKYADTYHNIGVAFVSALADHLSAEAFSSPSGKQFAATKMGGVIIAHATTFMNHSGLGVKELCDYYDLSPSDIAIVHDDSDMTVGTYKITSGQRSAGHRGVDSIIQSLGTNTFSRIKIGVRPPKEWFRKKAEKFVLKKISKKHLAVFDEVFEEIAQELDL